MIESLAAHFFLNPYAVPIVVVSAVIYLIGLFILYQNPKAIANVSFFMICIAVSLWLFTLPLVYMARNAETALLIYRRATFLGVVFITTSIYFFSVAWLGLFKEQKILMAGALAAALGFYALGWRGGWGFTGMVNYFWGYYPKYGVTNRIFLVYFFGIFAAAFYNFFRAYRGETEETRKKQIKLIAGAFIVSSVASLDFLPKLFYLPIYPVGYIFVFLWIVVVAYSIAKYKVMDIETVIHKTLMWAAVSSLVLLPLALGFYFFRGWLFSLSPEVFSIVGLTLTLAVMYYAKTIQPWIDHVFQRRKYDLERELIKFNDNLVYLKGLFELVQYIAQTVRDLLYVGDVQIFLKSEEKKSLVRVDPGAAEQDDLALNDPFVRWMENTDDIAQMEYVDLDPRFEKVKREARAFREKRGVKVSVPLILNGELIGLIALGPKMNLKPFRFAELEFLSDLRRAAAIAFSNSLRLIAMQENLRRWNEELEEKVRQRTRDLEQAQNQLVQAEKLATIGTLAGGVAHEINNPLTAILANAQLLKMTISGEDLESVNLIEEGAKRCQGIVQKLMKYSRKPMDAALDAEVDLNHVIENVTSFLGYQMEQENVHLVCLLRPVSRIRGIANELEQVFTNLLLNAKDAILEHRAEGTVEISTYETGTEVCALVRDNGVGIKEAHRSKIFDPFFTTKDVGSGTGLGLSITFGIVEKHNGKIHVESKEKEGAAFLLSFPRL